MDCWGFGDFLEFHLASLVFSLLSFCGLSYKGRAEIAKEFSSSFFLPFGSYLAAET